MKCSAKKLLSLLIVNCLLFTVNCSASLSNPLHTDQVIVVNDGTVEGTGILSDVDGTIFLEFLEGLNVMLSKRKTRFTGEILAPAILDTPPLDPPRARMINVFTFEILTNTGDEVTFIDKYALMNKKTRAKLQLDKPANDESEEPVKLTQTPGFSLYAKFPKDESVGKMAIWEFESEKERWKRIGGRTEDTEDETVQIFIAILSKTGTYALFDENPSPTFTPTFPIDQVQLAPPAPSFEAPSLPFGEEIPTETGEAPLEDLELLGEDDLLLLDSKLDFPEEVPALEEYEVPALASAPSQISPTDQLNTEVPALDELDFPEETAAIPNTQFDSPQNIASPLPNQPIANNQNPPLASSLQANLFSSAEEPPQGPLPKSGNEEKKPLKIPFGIILAISALIFSGFLAVRKKY